jgi:Domain of unknown function (DUF6894)
MPRYFFHIRDGYVQRDETGTELPDIYTAQAQAIRLSGELLQEMGAKFWNGTDWQLAVADEHGRTLFILRFSAEERIPLADPESDPSPP